MDGNGRWASKRGLPRHHGHREGSEAVRRTVRACRRLGVRALTLYAFSEQNWRRPAGEVEALMELLTRFLHTERAELIDHGIRLTAIGRLQRIAAPIRFLLNGLLKDTAHLDGMTLTLALSYGGREEIADVARELARECTAGKLAPNAISEDLLGERLPSMRNGPVDLLIRTGGEQRLSNFVLWSAAYAEFVFVDTLWPDFGEDELQQALLSFASRERRFGHVASPQSAEFSHANDAP